MTAILFWSGLVIVSNLYVTIPLVPTFAQTFDITVTHATWTSSAFSLFYAIGFLFFGPLSDRYGRKKIILAGLMMLTTVTPLIGFFDSLTAVIILRCIQGVAAATFAPAALTYAVEMFPTERKVTTIGFITTGFLMAGIVGQVFSSFINHQFGWQYVFYTLGGVLMITTILVIVHIPKDKVKNTNGDFLAAIRQITTILKNKQLLICYTITITLLLTFVGMYTALGSYLTEQFNLGSQEILYIRSIGIIGMVVSPFAGKLVAALGSKTVLRCGLALAVLGLVIIGISSNLSLLIMMSVIFVAGISITVPTLISLVGQLGGKARGSAVSFYTFTLFIGATLGPILTVWLLNFGNYMFTFEMLATFIGSGFLLSFFIRPTQDE